MNKLPFISVIVPVFNGADTIDRLLSCLQQQDYPVELREFIIVDDVSTDDTVAVIQAHSGQFITIRQTENRGSYVARNAGIARAQGSIFAFIDADCEPENNWISEGVRALRTQGSGLVAGAVAITPVVRNSAIQRLDQAFGIQQKLFATRMNFGATANLFVCRTALQSVPSFDESLRSGGDKKFCQSCVTMGERFSYCPSSQVRHAVRKSFTELVIKQVRISTGHAALFPLWSRLRILPLSVMPVESFDHAAFCRDEGMWFKLRFRSVYYALELIHLAAYGFGCIRRIHSKRAQKHAPPA